MNVAVCVDKRGGMMFNRRRQSRDSAVTARVLEIARERGGTLYVSAYSSALFDGADGVRVVTVDAVPTGGDGVFFVEDIDISGCIDKIDTLFVFNWNRRYPADRSIPFDPHKTMTLLSARVFAGTSHESVVEEVYVK